jgi:hypothetical protein
MKEKEIFGKVRSRSCGLEDGTVRSAERTWREMTPAINQAVRGVFQPFERRSQHGGYRCIGREKRHGMG